VSGDTGGGGVDAPGTGTTSLGALTAGVPGDTCTGAGAGAWAWPYNIAESKKGIVRIFI
jgi:hypothetical protein